MIQHPYWPSVYLSAHISPRARRWRNSPSVNKWCRQYTDITPDEHRAWKTRIAEDPTIRMFTVCETEKGEGVGVCGLTSINHVNQTAEFSLYIAPSHQQMGYGSQALQTLVHHGFEALNLNRIWGEVFDGNPAMEMFKQVGFKLEGRLRQSYFRDGRFIDSYLIALLRGEWCSRSAS